MKICRKCNKNKKFKEFYYHRTRKHYMATCKECNSKNCKTYQQNGYRDTEKYVFYQRAYEIKRRCKDKGIECIPNLQEHLVGLWAQSTLCAYSGLEMSLNGYHSNPNAMTVDRKNPELGYVTGNMVLCCSLVNRMKQNLTPEQLVSWCKLIASYLA